MFKKKEAGNYFIVVSTALKSSDENITTSHMIQLSEDIERLYRKFVLNIKKYFERCQQFGFLNFHNPFYNWF